jgi:hypothetical protein
MVPTEGTGGTAARPSSTRRDELFFMDGIHLTKGARCCPPKTAVLRICLPLTDLQAQQRTIGHGLEGLQVVTDQVKETRMTGQFLTRGVCLKTERMLERAANGDCLGVEARHRLGQSVDIDPRHVKDWPLG